MYYSYAMGIDNTIYKLKNQGFVIENDGKNYKVSFSKEKADIWESFITSHLEYGYWNEYIADDYVVFLFYLQNGIKKYNVFNFENAKVLELCEKLCGRKFQSLKAMLTGNHFYKEKINC